MNYWFECKVSYERQTDNLGTAKVSESYLVDALIEEVTPFAAIGGGDLEVVNIRRARIAELFLSEDPDHDRYYRAKVNFITVDEKSGKEKRTAAQMIVKSDSLQGAVKELTAQMDGQLSAYELASITETQIMDVYQYVAPAKDAK